MCENDGSLLCDCKTFHCSLSSNISIDLLQVTNYMNNGGNRATVDETSNLSSSVTLFNGSDLFLLACV